MPRLEIRSGKAAGQVVELSSAMVTLGNRRNASVELKDPWVGFNHAQITRQGDQFFIADMATKSGTFVNGQKVDRSPKPLANGDRIQLGKTEILFYDERATEKTDDAKPAAAAPAPSAPGAAAPAPVAPAGPFAPPTPVTAAPSAADAERMARLERELARAEKDLKDLRETFIAREKALSEANAKAVSLESKVRTLESAPPKATKNQTEVIATPELEAAKEEAARWKKAHDDITAKARIKLEELTRYSKTLEARLQQGGGDAATQLVEKDKEIARLREEGRRIQEEARVRLLEAAEKTIREIEAAEARAAAAGSGGGADDATVKELQDQLENAEKRAMDAEKASGALERQIETLQTKVRELERKLSEPSAADKELKTIKAELQAYEQALEERNADVARLEAALKRGGGSAAAAPAEAPSESSGEGADAGRVAELEAELERVRARAADLEKQVIDLRTQVEEINQDMLEQEDELRAEISELEKKLSEGSAANKGD